MSKSRQKKARAGGGNNPVVTRGSSALSKPGAVAVPGRKLHAAEACAKSFAYRATGVLRLLLPGIFLFLLIAFQGGASDKKIAVAAAVALILCSLGKTPWERIRRRISLPVLAVCAYLLLNAAAGLYSKFGNFAAAEFGKIFTAFCVFGILLFRLRDGSGRAAAVTFSSVTAAFSLISIDASSLGALTKAYVLLMNRMGCEYNFARIGYESGVRITGIFGNPNLLAGFLAFGVFLSLYLVHSARGSKSRLVFCILLEMNALGFLFAFSMGAIGMFFAAIFLYLLATPKGSRISLLVLMVETAAIGMIFAFPAFRGLGAQGAAAWLPVLAGPAGGVLLCLLHGRAGLALEKGLNRYPKAAVGTFSALIVLAVVYAVLAFNLTGGYSLSPGETLRRSVYPGPGTYTLHGNWSGPVTLTVESQNKTQTILHTSTVLYQGELSGATFTVPEDSQVVYLNLTSPEGAVLNNLFLSGGERVKLGYRLLPGFAANRLQGLWANQNAIQRTEFFRDGLRIFSNSPIIGNGLGSVEGLVTSVQRFFYESRYVHNHYIQVLAEMGVLGLLCFLSVMGSLAVVLIKRRIEREADPLLPALIACLAMMALHGATEAVWSVSPYQTLALSLIALSAVEFSRPVARFAGRTAGWIFSGLLLAFTVVFTLFLYGNISADKQYGEIRAGIREQTPYSMTELARMDLYNWAQYKLDMAVNAADSPVKEFSSTAAKYAAQLRKLKIHSINLSLARYHYAVLGQWEEAFAASREGILQSASRSVSWQELFSFYESVFPGENAANAAWFARQSLMLYDMLQEYGKDRLEPILLTQENLDFIRKMQAVADGT